jgi:hypothetical protein
MFLRCESRAAGETVALSRDMHRRRDSLPPPQGEVPSDEGSEIETKFPTDMDSISEPSYRGGGGQTVVAIRA